MLSKKKIVTGTCVAFLLMAGSAMAQAVNVLPLVLTKAFGAPSILLNGTTSLTFNVTNPNAVTLFIVAFSDTLPAGLVVSTPNGLTGSCAGGTITAVAGSNSISLAGASFTANATCTFAVNVTGTAVGPINNVTSTITSNDPGTVGPAATAVLTVLTPVVPPTIAKVFQNPVININGGTGLTFTITNPNATTLTGVNFTDTLPAGVFQTGGGVGLSLTCGAGAGANVVNNVITATGITLAPNANCTIVVNNIVGVLDGSFINTTSAIGSVEGGTGLTASAPITVLPIIDPEESFQVRYASNLPIGDSVINLTNTGTLTLATGPVTTGNLCVNVYTFDASEELISCCSCLVTPNGLNSLSARADLISNTLTPGVPTSIVIKLVASRPLGLTAAGTGGTCNPAAPTPLTVVPGMGAWGTTLHSLPTTPVTYGLTETPFSTAPLSVGELSKLTVFCGFIQANGSGFGICKSCRTGGLGAESK